MSSKLIDITGKTFNLLSVIKYDTESKWLCKCVCGKLIKVIGYRLRTGLTKSCGCRIFDSRIIDLTGKIFGNLTVVSLSNSRKVGRKDRYWECKCSCGKTVIKSTYYLQKTKHPSCNCYWISELSRKIKKNLLGKKFGRLYAIGDTGKVSKRGSVYWNCRCECGNTVEIETYLLINGNTKSCGCLQRDIARKQAKNILNKTFGSLRVISRAGSTKYRAALWKCRCKCGNITYIPYGSLVTGHSRSCGKCKWIGERYFIKKLNKYFKKRLYFKHQYSPTYLGQQHHDGYDIKNKIAVEYNGEQHYKPIKFYGGDRGYLSVKKLDKKKKLKCKKAGVKLFEFRPKKENLDNFIQKIENYLSKKL